MPIAVSGLWCYPVTYFSCSLHFHCALPQLLELMLRLKTCAYHNSFIFYIIDITVNVMVGLPFYCALFNDKYVFTQGLLTYLIVFDPGGAQCVN